MIPLPSAAGSGFPVSIALKRSNLPKNLALPELGGTHAANTPQNMEKYCGGGGGKKREKQRHSQAKEPGGGINACFAHPQASLILALWGSKKILKNTWKRLFFNSKGRKSRRAGAIPRLLV